MDNLQGLVMLRLDGKNFSRLTKKYKSERQQWHSTIDFAMQSAAVRLAQDVACAVVGYTVSDEISILLDLRGPERWFNGRTDKILSVTASIVTACFALHIGETGWYFDARVVLVDPSAEEVEAYFKARRSNGFSNAISSYASAALGHRETSSMSVKDRIAALNGAGIHVNEGLSHGYWVTRESWTGPVEYVHKKTNQINTVEVTRHRWTSALALTDLPLDGMLEA